MISKLFVRAWLLGLIGASVFTVTPHFLQAYPAIGAGGTGGSESPAQRRAEEREQRRKAAELRAQQAREYKYRNMHPELQVAEPFQHDDGIPKE